MWVPRRPAPHQDAPWNINQQQSQSALWVKCLYKWTCWHRVTCRSHCWFEMSQLLNQPCCLCSLFCSSRSQSSSSKSPADSTGLEFTFHGMGSAGFSKLNSIFFKTFIVGGTKNSQLTGFFSAAVLLCECATRICICTHSWRNRVKWT